MIDLHGKRVSTAHSMSCRFRCGTTPFYLAAAVALSSKFFSQLVQGSHSSRVDSRLTQVIPFGRATSHCGRAGRAPLPTFEQSLLACS